MPDRRDDDAEFIVGVVIGLLVLIVLFAAAISIAQVLA